MPSATKILGSIIVLAMLAAWISLQLTCTLGLRRKAQVLSIAFSVPLLLLLYKSYPQATGPLPHDQWPIWPMALLACSPFGVLGNALCIVFSDHERGFKRRLFAMSGALTLALTIALIAFGKLAWK
jgi:hypothetical protein